MLRISGFDILTNINMTIPKQHSRSPSRAKRRIKYGHPQHFIRIASPEIIQAGTKLIMHPETVLRLKEQVMLETQKNPQQINEQVFNPYL